MTIPEYSKKRLRAFLEEVSHLKGLEFPYPQSKQALEQIHDTLSEWLRTVEQLSDDSDPVIVRGTCKNALSHLFIYLPLLGFILRSTDVRNAFEIYGPLRRLSRRILGESAKLILSSEWDYSPFTYLDIPILQGFVLIGLPAPESANPLLVPLAGHELGHPVWRQRALLSDVSPRIVSRILQVIRDQRWDEYVRHFSGINKDDVEIDLSARRTWEPAYEWGCAQAEETFCDLFGLRLFKESYLHAFAYLLSPNHGGPRPLRYPNFRRRALNLVEAAEKYRVMVPPSYADLFEDMQLPSDADPQSSFLLELADVASQSVVMDLVEFANSAFIDSMIEEGNQNKVDEIHNDFSKYIVPARNPATLTAILNAGWEAFHDPDLWSAHPEIKHKDKTLKELILKSIEVLEFKTVMRGSE